MFVCFNFVFLVSSNNQGHYKVYNKNKFENLQLTFFLCFHIHTHTHTQFIYSIQQLFIVSLQHHDDSIFFLYKHMKSHFGKKCLCEIDMCFSLSLCLFKSTIHLNSFSVLSDIMLLLILVMR